MSVNGSEQLEKVMQEVFNDNKEEKEEEKISVEKMEKQGGAEPPSWDRPAALILEPTTQGTVSEAMVSPQIFPI